LYELESRSQLLVIQGNYIHQARTFILKYGSRETLSILKNMFSFNNNLPG